MKLVLLLAVALAAISSCTFAHGGGNGGRRDPPGGFLKCIENKIANNATLTAALITALNNAGLSQFVNGTTVNFQSLNNYLFSAFPSLVPFINQYIVASWPQLAPAVNATQIVINNLNTDVDTRNVFAGYLLIYRYTQYVSNSVNAFTIDFSGIQANATTARFLNRYIGDLTREILFPRYAWGPYGHF